MIHTNIKQSIDNSYSYYSSYDYALQFLAVTFRCDPVIDQYIKENPQIIQSLSEYIYKNPGKNNQFYYDFVYNLLYFKKLSKNVNFCDNNKNNVLDNIHIVLGFLLVSILLALIYKYNPFKNKTRINQTINDIEINSASTIDQNKTIETNTQETLKKIENKRKIHKKPSVDITNTKQ